MSTNLISSLFNKHTLLKALLLVVLPMLGTQIYAQVFLKQMIEVKELINQDSISIDDAYKILVTAEDKYIKTANDSSLVLFYENMGYVKYERKEYSEALKYYEHVPQLYERLNIKDRSYIESFLFLGVVNKLLGNDSIAERYYRTGLLRTWGANNSALYRSSFYLNLGQLYKKRGDSILARDCFENIDPRAYNSLLDAEHFTMDGELQAFEMREKGEYEQSLPVYDRLIKKVKETIGTNNEIYNRILYQKALVLSFNLKRNREAKPLFKELFEKQKDLPEYSEDVSYCASQYLQIAAYEGDSLEVDSIFSSALSYVAKSKNDTTVCKLYRLVGNGYYYGGKYSRAISYYEKYLSLGLKERGLSYLEIPNMLAVCYLLTNSQEKARTLLSGLINKYKDDIEKNTTLKIQIFHNYGRALMLCRKYKDAVNYLSIANQIYKGIKGKDNPKTQKYIEECKKFF